MSDFFGAKFQREISKAKGACATTKESCAQAGVATDAIKKQRMFKTVPRAGLRRDADEVEYAALKSTYKGGEMTNIVF